MASFTIKSAVDAVDAVNESISSCYFDVTIYTSSGNVKAHKLRLAQRSSWFHNLFRAQKDVCEYHIAFFNYSDKMISNVVDVIYGKDITIPVQEKNRVTALLTKLGVIWEEVNDEAIGKRRRIQEDFIAVADTQFAKPSSSFNLKEVIPPENNPSPLELSTEHPSREGREESDPKVRTKPSGEDIYELLDTFTETSDEELNRINHMTLGFQQTRCYKCLKCNGQSKYFTQAIKHHEEHEFLRLGPLTEILKKAEFERQSAETNIIKLNNAIGQMDEKKLKVNKNKLGRALREISENLHRHLETLDKAVKGSLPPHIQRMFNKLGCNIRES